MSDAKHGRQSTDRNLLFGLLALQMDFVGRDALIAALQQWAVEKDKPIGQILCDLGMLSKEQRTLLDALLEEHIKKHDSDPQRSLNAISSIGSVRKNLEQIADADLHASLAQVST